MKSWEITRKDLLLLGRDPRALLVLLALPMVFITIIGLTTGQLLGWKNENLVLRIGFIDRMDYAAVEDETQRREARNMVVKMLNGLQEQKGFRVERIPEPDDYRSLVDGDDYNAALLIGPRFFETYKRLDIADVMVPQQGALAEGLESLDMELYANADEASSTVQMIEMAVMKQAHEALAPYVACHYRSQSITENARIQSSCKELHAETAGPPLELKPPQDEQQTESNRAYQELVPGYTVMFVFFLVNIMARSFLHERDLGTLRRLKIAPVSRVHLLAGKTVPFFIVSIVQTVLLFLFGKMLFGMSWGNEPPLLIPIMLTTSLSATALGLLVATLVKSESQVSAYANLVVIAMAGVSGCFMPRDWLPAQMQTASLATPHAWSLIAYDQVLTRSVADYATILESCGVLTGFAVLFFALGCWRFGRVSG